MLPLGSKKKEKLLKELRLAKARVFESEARFANSPAAPDSPKVAAGGATPPDPKPESSAAGVTEAGGWIGDWVPYLLGAVGIAPAVVVLGRPQADVASRGPSRLHKKPAVVTPKAELSASATADADSSAVYLNEQDPFHME